ncbi:Uncharacterized protein APZ42_004664, partial [Daphnia magna]
GTTELICYFLGYGIAVNVDHLIGPLHALPGCRQFFVTYDTELTDGSPARKIHAFRLRCLRPPVTCKRTIQARLNSRHLEGCRYRHYHCLDYCYQ